MKHQVIRLGKGQGSFFLHILVLVIVLNREKWISKVVCTTYLYSPPLSLTILSYVNPDRIYICPLHYALLPYYPPCW